MNRPFQVFSIKTLITDTTIFIRVERAEISIEKEQKEWLNNHPHFNLSGFVREKLNQYIENYEDEE